MSALGQKQIFAAQNVMSALPPIADMCGATRHVRFVPKADIVPLFDHFICATDYWSWDVEPERLGSLEIDDQLDLRGLLDG